MLDHSPLGANIIDMLVEPAPLLVIHLQIIELLLQVADTGGGKFVHDFIVLEGIDPLIQVVLHYIRKAFQGNQIGSR